LDNLVAAAAAAFVGEIAVGVDCPEVVVELPEVLLVSVRGGLEVVDLAAAGRAEIGGGELRFGVFKGERV
jgi:hypothetical protein